MLNLSLRKTVNNMTIKELRAATGMSQKAFGEYFGIPHRTIQNWEGGQNKCPEYLLELMKYKLKKEGIISMDVIVRELEKELEPIIDNLEKERRKNIIKHAKGALNGIEKIKKQKKAGE